jgi:hypothetical protein
MTLASSAFYVIHDGRWRETGDLWGLHLSITVISHRPGVVRELIENEDLLCRHEFYTKIAKNSWHWYTLCTVVVFYLYRGRQRKNTRAVVPLIISPGYTTLKSWCPCFALFLGDRAPAGVKFLLICPIQIFFFLNNISRPRAYRQKQRLPARHKKLGQSELMVLASFSAHHSWDMRFARLIVWQLTAESRCWRIAMWLIFIF